MSRCGCAHGLSVSTLPPWHYQQKGLSKDISRCGCADWVPFPQRSGSGNSAAFSPSIWIGAMVVVDSVILLFGLERPLYISTLERIVAAPATYFGQVCTFIVVIAGLHIKILGRMAAAAATYFFRANMYFCCCPRGGCFGEKLCIGHYSFIYSVSSRHKEYDIALTTRRHDSYY